MTGNADFDPRTPEGVAHVARLARLALTADEAQGLAAHMTALLESVEVLQELDVILEGRPAFGGARIRLGVVLQKLGDIDGAVREWKRCAVDHPDDMRARAYLASVGVKYPQAEE